MTNVEFLSPASLVLWYWGVGFAVGGVWHFTIVWTAAHKWFASDMADG
jgi:hypothetical protein